MLAVRACTRLTCTSGLHATSSTGRVYLCTPVSISNGMSTTCSTCVNRDVSQLPHHVASKLRPQCCMLRQPMTATSAATKGQCHIVLHGNPFAVWHSLHCQLHQGEARAHHHQAAAQPSPEQLA
jgi:hypothetical protein